MQGWPPGPPSRSLPVRHDLVSSEVKHACLPSPLLSFSLSVCQIAPTLLSQDTLAKIGDFNEHLRIWSESNNAPLIKTYSIFRLGTGEVDDMSYDMEDDSPETTLNRLGIIRLFSTITKQCPNISMCKNIDNIKKLIQTPPPSQYSNTNQHQRNKDYTTSPSTYSGSHKHRHNPGIRTGITNNQTPNT